LVEAVKLVAGGKGVRRRTERGVVVKAQEPRGRWRAAGVRGLWMWSDLVRRVVRRRAMWCLWARRERA
jgi:hypothetical protein